MPDIDPMTLEAGDLLRDWNAREYLEYYYSHAVVPDDEAHMFRFLAGGLRDAGVHAAAAIELGCGGTMHHAALLAPYCDRLDMADVQESNLDELRSWLRGDATAFDWSVYIGGARGVLDAETDRDDTLETRRADMRAKIHVRPCDMRDPHPLGAPAQYGIVTSYYSAEWVIPTRDGWMQTMRHINSLLAPGGWLFLAGVHETDFCVVNGRRITCARIGTADIRAMLAEIDCDPATVHVDVTPGLAPHVSGIQAAFMAYARRGS